MGVCIRYYLDKHGEKIPRRNWFGEYRSTDGKRRREDLGVPVRGEPGTKAFEESRRKAVETLARIQGQMQEGRQTLTAANTRFRSLTGEKRKDTKTADLADKVTGGKPSWQTAKRGFVSAFSKWAQGRKLFFASEVRRADAQDYLSGLYESGGVTYETVKKVRATLRAVFAVALPEGEANPFDDVRVTRRSDDRTEHREPMNDAQVEALLQTAGQGTLEYDLIVCALCTALRRGDVCRLKWESVIPDRDGAPFSLDIQTSKTGARVNLPVFPKLREVLERRAAARRRGNPYVFPEAAEMIANNPDGITYRIKKIFAEAFYNPVADMVGGPAAAVPTVNLAQNLARVKAAVEAAPMAAARKAKMCAVLDLKARRMDYRAITAETGISRGAVSLYLHEAERLAGVSFLMDRRRDGIAHRIARVTSTARAVGTHAASKYDFHSLRTTFVTLAAQNSVPIDKVLKITGHSSRATVERFYDRARGVDFRADFENALPAVLTGVGRAGNKTRTMGAETDADALRGVYARLMAIREEVARLSPADRAELARMMRAGGHAAALAQ